MMSHETVWYLWKVHVSESGRTGRNINIIKRSANRLTFYNAFYLQSFFV